MRYQRLLAAVLLVLAAGLPVLAQPRPGSAELPLSRIVLFSSGVGYFQREGQVDGTARVDLHFASNHINDLLKSLVLQDAGGGHINTISYDNRDPLEKTLKSFALDLTNNPSLGQLLQQVRGERLEVLSYGEPGKEGQPVLVTGLLVGVQPRKKAHGKDQVLETEQLNLLTNEGLQGVDLAQVQRIRFLKPELEQEFRKALAVLAQGHDQQKKTVSFHFLGSGKRPVKVGYVLESPLWKTSYRLSLDKGSGKVFLQGWAVVENTSDEDWNQVRLGLVSGRPISFQMDLYEPLYVPRPMVEPELFASLRPQVYGGAMISAARPVPAPPLPPMAGFPGTVPAPEARAAEGLQASFGRRGGIAAERKDELGLARKLVEKEGLDKAALNFREGVASAAITTELGEYFQYEIEQPVSLPRQKSALLPIVDQPVEAARVSIYNEAVHSKFPLLGLRFKNTTGLHLMQGPVTVFESNTYAGDARLADLQPNESRLLSYAVDLGTEVQAEVKQAQDSLVAVKIARGLVQATHKLRQSKHYTVKNRSEHDRLVLVEHPYRSDWKLISPEQAVERSREVYRFEVKAQPNQPVHVEVVEEKQLVNTVALSSSPDETVRLFLRSNSSSPKVKEALERALQLKEQLVQTQRQIQREEQTLKGIEQDQARMRANMERVPQTSEAYKRYLKKFDDQETEIEKRREQIGKFQETTEQQRKNYENFLLTLNVE